MTQKAVVFPFWNLSISLLLSIVVPLHFPSFVSHPLISNSGERRRQRRMWIRIKRASSERERRRPFRQSELADWASSSGELISWSSFPCCCCLAAAFLLLLQPLLKSSLSSISTAFPLWKLQSGNLQTPSEVNWSTADVASWRQTLIKRQFTILLRFRPAEKSVYARHALMPRNWKLCVHLLPVIWRIPILPKS